MRAALIHRYGGPEVFQIQDVEPAPVGPRDLLIDVYASSVNPVDCKIRSGVQRLVNRPRLPWVLGLDVSGVVREVGKEVRRFKPGDAVYSSPTHRRPGCYAEQVVIHEDAVAHKPSNLTHVEAASLPLVSLTAWEALINFGHMQEGQRVFVQAGSGGVGSVAIQLAKAKGAYVASTCSTRNVELVKELGADRVVDYTQEHFDRALRDYDVALESLGGNAVNATLRILKAGGRMATITAGLPYYVNKYGLLLGTAAVGLSTVSMMLRARALYSVAAKSVLRPCDGKALGEITKLVEAGSIKPLIDRVLPLEAISEAHRYSETGRARGKIVIAIRDDASSAR